MFTSFRSSQLRDICLRIKMNLTKLFILLLSLGLASSTKLFHHGRPRHGFIGSPNIDYDGELPRDQWITQKLDNFNDADLRTWDQVCMLKI